MGALCKGVTPTGEGVRERGPNARTRKKKTTEKGVRKGHVGDCETGGENRGSAHDKRLNSQEGL